MYGVDVHGELYVHVKIYKQGKVYGEVYCTGGTVLIRCRNCFRLNRVTFVSRELANLSASLVEEGAPPVDADIRPA